jgi:uncharacterized small protein (DUF1192 family)
VAENTTNYRDLEVSIEIAGLLNVEVGARDFRLAVATVAAYREEVTAPLLERIRDQDARAICMNEARARIRELEAEVAKAGNIVAAMVTGNPKPADLVRLDAACDWICSKLDSGFHWIAYDMKRELTEGRLRYEGADVLHEKVAGLEAEVARLKAPEAVCDAFERLARERAVFSVDVTNLDVGSGARVAVFSDSGARTQRAATLAEAMGKLGKEQGHER